MQTGLSFNDITLVPAPFTSVASRKDVTTSVEMCGTKYELGVISSNMDTVYSPELAKEVARMGGVSCVHRFCTIEENVNLYIAGIYKNVKPWVSVGLNEQELLRAKALREAGAEVVVIDVANAASQQAVDQFIKLKEFFPKVVVGNFGTNAQIQEFIVRAKAVPDMIKVSIGSGSACQTRIVTGVGLPSVTTIQDCAKAGIPMIFDGGITNSGDFCKAIALGCTAVMCGKLFAATQESAAIPVDFNHKMYRGSASLSSYKVQGKESNFRAPEGEEFLVKISGSVENLMNNFSGGLRSSMSYLNATDLSQFKKNANYIQVTHSSSIESKPHGK